MYGGKQGEVWTTKPFRPSSSLSAAVYYVLCMENKRFIIRVYFFLLLALHNSILSDISLKGPLRYAIYGDWQHYFQKELFSSNKYIVCILMSFLMCFLCYVCTYQQIIGQLDKLVSERIIFIHLLYQRNQRYRLYMYAFVICDIIFRLLNNEVNVAFSKRE